MKKWTKDSMSSKTTIIPGYAFDSRSFVESGVPIIKIGNVKTGYVDLEDNSTQYVNSHFLNTLNKKYHVNNRDILISLTGSHLTQPNSVVGRVGRYRYQYTALVNQRAAKIEAKNGESDKDFVYHLLSTYTLRKEIALLAHGAANQANVSHKDIEKIKVFWPPLHIQQKIAAILSAYDDLIDNNNRRIAILEKMAEELYREWFVRMRFPNYEKTKFTKGVPEGWSIVPFGFLVKEVRRTVKRENIPDDKPYVGLEHIPQHSFTLESWSETSSISSDKLLFKKNEILFGKIRPYLHKVCLSTLEGYCSTDTIVLSPINEKYLYLALQTAFSKVFVDYANTTSKGTKMPRADWEVMKKFKIYLPSSDILSKYNDLSRIILEKTSYLVQENRLLKQSRDMLLSRLLNGKLDVEELDIQFPASMKE